MGTKKAAPKEPTAPEEAPVAAPKLYRVFSERWALVAQVDNEEEARTIAQKFNGTYKPL